MARKTVKRYGNTYIYEDGKLVQTIRGNTQKKGESGAQGQAVVTRDTYKKQTKPASSYNTTIQKPKDSIYTQDPSLNRYRGVNTWTQRMNDKYNRDWTDYQESLKNVTVDSSKYDSYISSGKEKNKLRKDRNDYDEGTLEFFDMLYGSGNVKKADEGVNIIRNINKNAETYNSNIEGWKNASYKTYERQIEDLDKQTEEADKRLEKAVIQDEYRKGTTGMMSTSEEAKLRREALQQRLADAISNGNYKDQAQIRAEIAQTETIIANTDAEKARSEIKDMRQERAQLVVADNYMQNFVLHEDEYANMGYNERLESVKRGKEKDTYLVDAKDVKDPVSYIAETGTSTEDFDLKTASMFMTSVEKNKYYTVLDKYGEEEAKAYLKELYNNVLGERTANALAEETTDSKYGFAFGFGVADAVKNIGYTFSSIGTDDVKVESLAKKTFQSYAKDGNDMLLESLYSIGNMVPAIAASIATQGIGAPAIIGTIASSGTTFSSVYGDTYYEARRQGYTSEESSGYAILTAGSEAFLQSLLSGVSSVAGGSLLKGAKGFLAKAIGRVVKNPVGRYALAQLANQAINSAGEFSEEYIQGVLEPVFRNIALGENNNTDPFSEEALYQGIMGALTAGLTNSVTIAGDSVRFGNQQKQISQIIKEAKTLAPTTDAFKTATWLEQNEPDADNVALLMKQIEREEIDEDSIKQFIDGDIEWNDITDTGRSMLVNPQNAEYIASKFGIDVNSEMSPIEIKEAVKAKVEENKTEQNIFETVNEKYTPLATTIKNEYSGIKPTQNKESYNVIEVKENSFKEAVKNFDKARQQKERSFKSFLTSIYKSVFSKKNLKSIAVDNTTFNNGKYIVSISNRAIGKIISDANISAEKLAIINDLSSIVKNANFVNSGKYEPKGNKNKDVIRYDYFETPVVINNKNYTVSFDVEVYSSTNNYRTHKVIENIKIDSNVASPQHVDPASTAVETTPSPVNSVPQEKTISQEEPKITEKEKIKTKQQPKVVAGREILSKMPARKKSTAEKKDARTKFKEDFTNKFIDEGGSFAALSKVIKDKAIINLYDNARRSKNMADAMIGVNNPGIKTYQSDFRGNNVGKNLYDIWKPVYDADKKTKGYKSDFFEYLLLELNIDRIDAKNSKEKAIFDISREDSRARADELLDEHPEFASVAKEIWNYNHNLLKYRRSTHLISYAEYKNLQEKYPHYIPVFGENDVTTTELSNEEKTLSSTMKKATTKKSGNILPIDEVMARQTRNVVMSGQQNMLAYKLGRTLKNKTTEVSSFIKKDTLIHGGYNINTEMRDVNQKQKTRKAGSITYYADGKKHELQVSNGILSGFQALSNAGANAFSGEGVLRKVNTIFKSAVTNYNPIFVIKNLSRDMQDAVFYSTDFIKFAKNYPKAWKQIATKGDVWQKYLSLGALNSSQFDVEKGFAKANSSLSKLKQYTIGMIETANIAAEQAARLAEFMTVLDNTKKIGNEYTPEQIQNAVSAAADITVNFGRQGSITRVLNRSFVPYLNASIQGSEKLIRSFTSQPIGKSVLHLAVKATALGIASAIINNVIVNAICGNDPEELEKYNSLYQSDKDNNFLIPLGNGQWLKIPRGRITALFAGLGNRAYDIATGKSADFKSGELIELLFENAAPMNPITNNIFSPVIQVHNNESWYGTEIESEYDNANDPTVSEVGKWLSNVLDGIGIKFGAKKVDYLLNQYGGIFADILLPLSTKEKGDEDNFITNAFVLDAVKSNTGSQNFKAKLEELTVLEEDSQQDVAADENGNKVFTSESFAIKYMNEQKQIVSDLWDEIEKIQNDESLTEDEKNELIRPLREVINLTYGEATGNADRVLEAVDKYYNDEVDVNAHIEIQNKQAEIAYIKGLNDVFGAQQTFKVFLSDKEYQEIQKIAQKGVSYETQLEFYIATHSANDLVGTYWLDEEGNGKNTGYTETEKRMLLGMSDFTEHEKQVLYENEFENSSTQYKKSIKYAVENGAKVNDFIDMKNISSALDGKVDVFDWFENNIEGDDNIKALYEVFFETDSINQRKTISYATKYAGVSVESFIKRQKQKINESGVKSGTTEEADFFDGNLLLSEKDKTKSGSKEMQACKNLLNSNYTDKEIEYFYSTEFDNDAYAYSMASGISAKTFVKYRYNTLGLSSDKDKNGKTINGSLKKKVMKALRTLNIPYEQQLLIAMLDKGYSFSDSEEQLVKNYITKLNINTKEKNSLLKKAGL